MGHGRLDLSIEGVTHLLGNSLSKVVQMIDNVGGRHIGHECLSKFP